MESSLEGNLPQDLGMVTPLEIRGTSTSSLNDMCLRLPLHPHVHVVEEEGGSDDLSVGRR